MSPRTGRPKANNPKSKDVKVRIDEKTAAKLDDYCRFCKLTRAEAIRQGIYLLLDNDERKGETHIGKI